MKKIRATIFLIITIAASVFAQPSPEVQVPLKKVPHTSLKDQAGTSTCWSFATTSLVESQAINLGLGEFDLSEMYTVRNIYKEKARNYVLRQGKAQFSPGGLGHDVMRAIEEYGAVPEQVYSGLLLGKKSHDHDQLDAKLKSYLDNVIKTRPFPEDWLIGLESILDDHLGKVPASFTYREKTYTPKTFAREVLKFSAGDFVYLTSFNHHPFFTAFILEVPDNFSNGIYHNLPLDVLMQAAERAVEKGYSVVWDGDVSNINFNQRSGFALHVNKSSKPVDPDVDEDPYSQEIRQKLFENLVTQDDHLMHIVGLEKSKQGKKFFIVKDSYGNAGPFQGYIKISKAYFAINTISLVVPKAALDSALKTRLRL